MGKKPMVLDYHDAVSLKNPDGTLRGWHMDLDRNPVLMGLFGTVGEAIIHGFTYQIRVAEHGFKGKNGHYFVEILWLTDKK